MIVRVQTCTRVDELATESEGGFLRLVCNAVVQRSKQAQELSQEGILVYNCSNMEIYRLFDISAIVFHDCISEIQQKTPFSR